MGLVDGDGFCVLGFHVCILFNLHARKIMNDDFDVTCSRFVFKNGHQRIERITHRNVTLEYINNELINNKGYKIERIVTASTPVAAIQRDCDKWGCE